MTGGAPHIVLLVVVTGFASVAAFTWAWWTGKLDDFDAQSHSVLDARDARLERPWESADEQAARARSYGPLLAPAKGEWGDAGHAGRSGDRHG